MTHPVPLRILIVDDDYHIGRTLSAILQSEGYQTAWASTAREALEKAEAQFFNLALLDIKLPDMEGTKLLVQLLQLTPETIEIMVTGYPSIQNAVQALNLGADSYIMKPIDPAELIKTIKTKIAAKQQAEKITKEKLARWIQSQTYRKHSAHFKEFLEETANELADFGLTKTQAKIYITLTALGVASVSEISAISKIRREEVYRTTPKLEKHGIITRKLKTPRTFSAIHPKKIIQLLIKTKLENMKEEIDKLKQKQVQLISKLETIEMPIHRNNCSTDIISSPDLFTELMDMTQKAKQKIDAILSLESLRYICLNNQKNPKTKLPKTIEIRMITEQCETNAFTKEITQFLNANNNRTEVKQLKILPFNLVIADDDEAMWGEFQHKNEKTQNLWTNDPTQINILKMSFENLWQKPLNIKETKDG